MCILHTWVRETQEAGSTQFFPATQCRKPPANRYATCTTVRYKLKDNITMINYIKKYSILLISSIGLLGLLKFLVISQLNVILINNGVELNQANFLTNNITFYLPYIFNLLIAIVIFTDLTRNQIKPIPTVLLTLFSYYGGVIFFLLLINNKIQSDDK